MAEKKEPAAAPAPAPVPNANNVSDVVIPLPDLSKISKGKENKKKKENENISNNNQSGIGRLEPEECIIDNNGDNVEAMKRIAWKRRKLNSNDNNMSIINIDSYRYWFEVDSFGDAHVIDENLPKSFSNVQEWTWTRADMKSNDSSIYTKNKVGQSVIAQRSSHTATVTSNNDIYLLGSFYQTDKKAWGNRMDCWLIKSNQIDEYIPLKTFGFKQSARWSHSAVYISPINAIFIYGGFDHTKCWAHPRLLFLNDYHWFDMSNIKGSHMAGSRATHTSCARYRRAKWDEIPKSANKIFQEKKDDDNDDGLLYVCQVYIFGGICLNSKGSDYYDFKNDVYIFEFFSNGYCQVKSRMKELKKMDSNFNGENDIKPIARSQHFATIVDNNKMYVFGGVNENINATFNDMWILNLDNLQWSQIDYNISNCEITNNLNITNMNELNNFKIDNIDLKNNKEYCNLTNDNIKGALLFTNVNGLPPPRRVIKPTGKYMTVQAQSPTFHSQKDGKLLIFHWNSLEYENQFYGNEAPYLKGLTKSQADKQSLYYLQNNKIKDEISKLRYDYELQNSHKILNNFLLNYDRCHLYIFDLKSKQWQRQYVLKPEKSPKEFQRAILVRIGSYIAFLGGRRNKGQATTFSPTDIMVALKLSMTLLPWTIERLIWIAFYKQDKNCIFGKKEMNKDIIGCILSFFNHNKFFKG